MSMLDWNAYRRQLMVRVGEIAKITVRCDGCIAVHTEAAARHGASREEIAEALAVATAVNAGAALVYSARVLDAYEQVTPRQPA